MDKQFSRKIIFFNFFYSLVMIGYHANATVHFANVVSTGSAADVIMSGIDRIFTQQSGTYFFMLLSAFLLYRDLTPDQALRKVQRRIKTLLVPWLLWNLIGLAANHPFDLTIKEIFSNYFMSRFCEQLWFVEALLLFLVLLPVFMRLLKVRFLGEIVVVLLFVLEYLGYPGIRMLPVFPSERAFGEVMRMLAHLPVYSLGAYLGLNMVKPLMAETYNEKHRKMVVVCSAFILLVSYLPVNHLIGSVCFMLRSAALWAICSKKMFDFAPKWWMQVSFYVYAIHNFILYITGKCIRLSGIFEEQYRSQTISVGFALSWRICLSVIAFVLALASAAVLMKFAPKVYVLLSGGRVPKKTDGFEIPFRRNHGS